MQGCKQYTFIWYSFYHPLRALHRVLQLQGGAQELVPGRRKEQDKVSSCLCSAGEEIRCHGYVLSPGQESVTCIFGFIATRLVPHFRELLQLVL